MNHLKSQLICFLVSLPMLCISVSAQERLERSRTAEVDYPPNLPGGQRVVTDRSPDFLKPADSLLPGVKIAKTPPTIDFLYYPGQTYPGKPWSNWGDSLAINGKYYASIGDHLAPRGNAFVYEYDPATKKFRQLADVQKVLNLPEGHYTPGKIHGRLDMGKDGWIYFSTHRGSKRVTTDEHHYEGDWIFRCDPVTIEAEIVCPSPIPKHSIPNTVLDPERMIFYGATASGMIAETEEIRFFAYDLENKKLLTSITNGPSRYMMFSPSQNTIYYTPNNDLSPLMKFDPADDSEPQQIAGEIGIRAATEETKDGMIYSVSQAGRGEDNYLYSFNVKSRSIEKLGPVAVGSQQYVATIDAGPNGRYLYYVPGAHGGSDKDGTPIVQYDVKTNTRKVLAFLDPYYRDKYRAIIAGTYSIAVDPAGDKLYITWNVSRGSRAWDCCALTVIHIPESERPE